MDLIFTEFVGSLEPDKAPDPEQFDALWGKLRNALIREIKRRRLWNAPPRYLGVCGAASWSQGDALDELLADCYSFTFLERLPGLKAHLKVKDNIEGLVFRNIRNFCYDTQKRHDPLGFKTFVALQSAVRQLVSRGELLVVRGDPRISNETVLGFQPETVPLERRELEDCVRAWCESLLPELIKARGKGVQEVVKRLEVLISRLPGLGVRAFSFEDLARPLKDEVRKRWHVMGSTIDGEAGLEEAPGEPANVIPIVDADRGVEDRDAFEKLSTRVSEALEAWQGSSTTRGCLYELWVHLRADAVSTGEQKPPSRRELARRLGISRDRLSGLLARLGRQVESCRSAFLPDQAARSNRAGALWR